MIGQAKPVLLMGSIGVGKTSLMQVIGEENAGTQVYFNHVLGHIGIYDICYT